MTPPLVGMTSGGLVSSTRSATGRTSSWSRRPSSTAP